MKPNCYSKTGLHNLIFAFILLLSTAGLAKNTEKGIPGEQKPMKTLETVFITAPDSIQTSVYWYWISDNISKEGVIKDLVSMKEIGINRAFIGNIGLSEVPYGKVKIFSDE